MYTLVLTCEHAGRAVPAEYVPYFASPEAGAALGSHRGWDPGAIEVAEELSRMLGAPLLVQRVSRLLVECNRSIGHRALWSEFSMGLGVAEKQEVLRRFWTAHRDAVRDTLCDAPRGVTVVHVGVHSFTPFWRGRPRTTDMGVLYDPARPRERSFAVRWQRAMQAAERTRGLVVHRNRPYRGWTDGLTTTLRREFGGDRYVGIELEVSQRLVPLDSDLIREIGSTLASTLAQEGRSPEG